METSVGLIEAIFKFPIDKPPYLGVVFGIMIQGQLLNANWVKEHSKEEWMIKVEIERQRLGIILYCTKLKLKHTYDVYSFNQVQLVKFITEANKVEYFNFGHVDKKKDVYTAIRTTEFKPWVLSCSSIELQMEF